MVTAKLKALFLLVSAGMIVCPASVAYAFSITQTSSLNTLVNSFFGDTSGLTNFEVEFNGDARGFGIFQDDPFLLQSGLVLSTGKVSDIVGVNSRDSAGQDLSTDFGESGEDLSSIILEFDTDSTKDTLFFQYVFGSEEFLEFGGSGFNDSFEFRLNGINLATLTDGRPATINQLFFDPEPSIESDTDPHHPDFIYNPAIDHPSETGPASELTKLDGYTRPLLFSGSLLQNQRNSLEIIVQDVDDGIYDSAVFLKADTFGTVEPSSILGDGLDGFLADDATDDGGTDNDSRGDNFNGNDSVSVPEPSSLIGLVIMSCLGLRQFTQLKE